jgi:hypothetical protein
MEFVGGQTLVGHIRDNLYDAVGAATAQAFFDGFRYRLRGKGGGGGGWERGVGEMLKEEEALDALRVDGGAWGEGSCCLPAFPSTTALERMRCVCLCVCVCVGEREFLCLSWSILCAFVCVCVCVFVCVLVTRLLYMTAGGDEQCGGRSRTRDPCIEVYCTFMGIRFL